MQFKIYTTRKEFIYKQAFNTAGFEYKFITEIPDEVLFDELLILDIEGTPSQELVDLLQKKNLKYLTFADSYTLEGIPQIIKFGGGIFYYSNLDAKEIPHIIRTVVEDIKIRDLTHHFTHNELELFRFIGRLLNAEKQVLIQILYGATNETTLDVNLNRLRKKLKDPEMGNDFFRVISKNKRLHIVSKIRGYKPFPEI